MQSSYYSHIFTSPCCMLRSKWVMEIDSFDYRQSHFEFRLPFPLFLVNNKSMWCWLLDHVNILNWEYTGCDRDGERGDHSNRKKSILCKPMIFMGMCLVCSTHTFEILHHSWSSHRMVANRTLKWKWKLSHHHCFYAIFLITWAPACPVVVHNTWQDR